MAKIHVDPEFQGLIIAAYEEALGPYIEAMASTIEGKPSGQAWHDFELVLSRALLLTQLLGLASVVDAAEIAGGDFEYDKDKDEFAKSDTEWPLDAGMEGFFVEPYWEAIDLFEERVPMVRSNALPIMEQARENAQQIAKAEKLNVQANIDPVSRAVGEALNKPFFVSGTDRSTIIDIRQVLANTLRGVSSDEYASLPEFIEIVQQMEGAQELTAAHLETVFRTNLSSAFNAANAAAYRSEDVQDIAPLIMLTELNDDRSRPHHAAMDGYINTAEYFDAKDLHPPNGYNCRGGTEIVTWDEAESMGLVGNNAELDWGAINRRNKPMQKLVDSGQYPDPGFG